MSPLPSLKVDGSLFEQIRTLYRDNHVAAHGRVSEVVFKRASELNVELDGNKWIQALVLTIHHRRQLYSKQTLQRLLRTYAREVAKNYKKGWQSVSVHAIYKKQFQQPILGKVPFRPVCYTTLNRWKHKVIAAMDNVPPHVPLEQAAFDAIDDFDYPPYSLIFDEWFEYKDGKNENPFYYH